MHAAAPSVLKPLSHGVQTSFRPSEKVFTAQGTSPVRALFGLCPAVAAEQKNEPCLDEYSPGPSHGSHVAPLFEYVPGKHSMHCFVSKFVSVPGSHFVQKAEPSMLNPLVQVVQSSRPPSENVLTGHFLANVRAALGLYPAVTTEQKIAPDSDEYSPGPLHSLHIAPSSE